MEVELGALLKYDDMKRVYEELEKQEGQVEKGLEELIKKQHILTQKMKTIPKFNSILDILSDESCQLKAVVGRTSELAENISSKVRQLDHVKGNIQDCIKRVDDILDLKSCVDGVKSAFQNEEYEQAAAFIHRYLSLDERALREILPEDSKEADLNASFSYLHKAKASLQEDVHKKFDEAVITSQSSQVERFFKLFPLVGLQDEGLLKFSKYLRKQISEKSELQLDSVLHAKTNELSGKFIYAESLKHLFESVAQIVEDHQPLVDTFYGPGMIAKVLKELQIECDTQSKYIFKHFFEAHRFEQVCEVLGNSSDSKDGKEKLDPKELDMLLGEMVLLSASAELYQNFLKNKIQNDVTEKPAEGGEEIYGESGVCRRIETMLSDYIVMESYFLKHMMLKALAMDVGDVDSLTSSAVDDVFFVLQKSLRRTISTRNTNISCAVINNASAILTSDYVEFYRAKIKYSSPSSIDLSGMFQGKNSTKGSSSLNMQDFLIVLNNLDTSCQYLSKLIEDFQMECRQKVNQNETEIAKLTSCLSDLGGCSQTFKECLQTGVMQLCTNLILPKINPLIDSFYNVKHVLTEEDFSYYEINDPFVQNLISTIEQKLSSFKDLLTTTSHASVVTMLCHEIAIRLEKTVTKCTFNRLGGLQLDKDLRSLVQYLTNTSEWTVRDKFARITQISTLLNLEKVSELMEYWGENSGPLTWRLTPGEVRAVLALRSDFRNEDIQRLSL